MNRDITSLELFWGLKKRPKILGLPTVNSFKDSLKSIWFKEAQFENTLSVNLAAANLEIEHLGLISKYKIFLSFA